MWGKLSLSTSEKVCIFFIELYTSGELETWLEKSLYLKKNTPIENTGIESTEKMISPFVSLSGLEDELKNVCLAL